MAFRMALTPTYETEVTITYPTELGQYEKHKFFVRFKRLTQPELDAFIARKMSDREALHEVVAGWRWVQDDEGKDIEFSPQALDDALNVYPMQPTMVNAFFDSIRAAREKNS